MFLKTSSKSVHKLFRLICLPSSCSLYLFQLFVTFYVSSLHFLTVCMCACACGHMWYQQKSDQTLHRCLNHSGWCTEWSYSHCVSSKSGSDLTLRNSGNKSLQSHDFFHTWMNARLGFRVMNLWRMFWNWLQGGGRRPRQGAGGGCAANCDHVQQDYIFCVAANIGDIGHWGGPLSAADYPVALATQDIRHGWMDRWMMNGWINSWKYG